MYGFSDFTYIDEVSNISPKIWNVIKIHALNFDHTQIYRNFANIFLDTMIDLLHGEKFAAFLKLCEMC